MLDTVEGPQSVRQRGACRTIACNLHRLDPTKVRPLIAGTSRRGRGEGETSGSESDVLPLGGYYSRNAQPAPRREGGGDPSIRSTPS